MGYAKFCMSIGHRVPKLSIISGYVCEVVYENST